MNKYSVALLEFYWEEEFFCHPRSHLQETSENHVGLCRIAPLILLNFLKLVLVQLTGAMDEQGNLPSKLAMRPLTSHSNVQLLTPDLFSVFSQVAFSLHLTSSPFYSFSVFTHLFFLTFLS